MHCTPFGPSRFLLLSIAGGLGLVLTACLASGQSSDRGPQEMQGAASYYADKFAGETTASGETFDPEAMTAAHPDLPFGTRVRVTRLDGPEASVTVRINDRGPYAGDRIIDLSEAAARQIGMIEEGVVDVRVEVLDRPSGAKAETRRENEAAADGW